MCICRVNHQKRSKVFIRKNGLIENKNKNKNGLRKMNTFMSSFKNIQNANQVRVCSHGVLAISRPTLVEKKLEIDQHFDLVG